MGVAPTLMFVTQAFLIHRVILKAALAPEV
jgi:hypothetical protein